MSSIDPFAAPNSHSPFHSADTGAYPAGYYQPVRELNFMRMIAAPFKSPNWPMNVIWMFVGELASVIMVGRIIQYGYLAEVAEARSGGRVENWPDFNLDRFTEYLLRGLWPFLWNLIWSMLLLICIGIPFAISVVLSQVLTQNGNDVPGAIIAIVGFGACGSLLIVSIFAMSVSMMHSALGNDFIKGADWRWISSYLSKAGGTTILAGFLYLLTGIGTSLAGLMLFCVGFLFSTPLLYLMGADLMAQLHDIFVSRGGTPAFAVPALEVEIIDAQVII